MTPHPTPAFVSAVLPIVTEREPRLGFDEAYARVRRLWEIRAAFERGMPAGLLAQVRGVSHRWL